MLGPAAKSCSKCLIVSSILVLFLTCLTPVSCQSEGQILKPPYFNLAEGRNITASSTCGVGVPEPELYCKLVGAYWHDKTDNLPSNLIQGQACDYCDPNEPSSSHPAQYAIDGTESWWQSPPLSRGPKYNEVNLTIDLGQEFHVAYVFIKMANSPRPGVWALLRSRDHGKTYTPWQYFADTPGDCIAYFGYASLSPITRDDSVVCETKFSSVVPLEGGEIVVSLLNGRPSAENFSSSESLQEWSTATNIRLSLRRPKTTLGHLLDLVKQNPTITRRYYYSVKDINIGGRCVCNGHADQCDQVDPTDPYKLLCRCQHNTCGPQCEQCCSGFQQHPWQRATVDDTMTCEKCNCFGHSNECYYDAEVDKKQLSMDNQGQYKGGGVCVNCQHNTDGINCNKCKSGFFRPRNKPLSSPDVCTPCQCDLNFSTGNCSEGTGQCECKVNFQAPFCDRCSYGYYSYPQCIECDCFPNGTYGNVCELQTGSCPCREGYTGTFCKQCADRFYGFPTCNECNCHDTHSLSDVCDIGSGQCVCANSFGGQRCDQCDVGFYDYPRCQFCSCDPIGTTEETCNSVTGECFCREGYSGTRCDRCEDGYFGYPNCTKCNCDDQGSLRKTCDQYGKCFCQQNYGGLKCDDCAPGFFKYPECLPCICKYPGSIGVTCDFNGRCICGDRFEGEKCDKCKQGYYNYPRCEECNCNPAGLVAQFGGCDKVQEGKLCECKERVTGRICNQCKDLYWNLQINNPLGCEDCLCERNGTLSALGLCDGLSGDCICKDKVYGRRCDKCKDDTYQLDGANSFGCLDCACDIGGSIHSSCNKTSGQCFCKPRIKGRQCTEPIEITYFPTLYQFQYEVEDWRNPTGSPARFGHDEAIFPNHSWRGYAIFTDLQREILINMTIQKPSLYRAIFRYINLNNEPVNGVLTFTPNEVFGETQQSSQVIFEASKDPKLLMVAGKPGLPIAPLVLNPGLWEVSLKVDKNDLMIDYLILLPQSYYDPTIFQDKVNEPCKMKQQTLCRHYSYPKMPFNASVVRAIDGFTKEDDSRKATNIYDQQDILQELKTEHNLAWLNDEQTKINFDVPVKIKGPNVIVITYHNPTMDSLDGKIPLSMKVEASEADDKQYLGTIMLQNCLYSFMCRQIITDDNGKIATLDLDNENVQLTFQLEEPFPSDFGLAIDSVTAIPLNETWSLDYVNPQFVCVRKNGRCIDSSFDFVPEANKVEFEKDQNRDKIATKMPFDTTNMPESNIPKLVLLNDELKSIDVRGLVSNPGPYNILIHYYQPDHANFVLDAIIQNGQFYNAFVPISHCPSQTGCRAVVKIKEENSTVFQILENFLLTLVQPGGKSVWVDYAFIVPAENYDPAVMNLKVQDKNNEFLSGCAKDTFFIDPDQASEFCRKSIFSLTVDYNGGALPCQCNTDGSLDYKCKSFGGQCNCKPNVIGRTCSRCKTGYYGFPNCKQCNCPSTAVCHILTGECICPRGVTGERCDRCLPFTYGFDPIIGCEDCDCERHGVLDRDLQCDVESGQCKCKQNVVGKKCDKCKAGFWSHPFCQLCRCEFRGTTSEICDQTTSRCFCKENVYGDYCDSCKPDAYNLAEKNTAGCTKCFCFGTTDRCTSSSLKTVQILSMDEGWKVANLIFTEKAMNEQILNDVRVEYVNGKVKVNQPSASSQPSTNNNVIIYFIAPKEYLGNRITSYGGIIKYSIQNVHANRNTDDTTGLVAADLILKGSNITIIHEHIEQPNMEDAFEFNATLIEKDFRHLNGHSVTREQIMMILVKLEAIYIRGTYFEPITEIYLDNVLLDKAIEGKRLADAPRALSVEQCNCPQNYKGTSCEECAQGYYRAKTGPHLGFCLPCQCNGHSNECDPVTGTCFNCQHNTVGDHCEKCISGYHGIATKGTPYDCLICACPLPIASNNFATSCEVSSSSGDVYCECISGYTGDRCQTCAANHFGRPEVIGQSCQACNCSGNVNRTDPASCNPISGICSNCMFNTSGEHCEVCKDGFYGDAVVRKNCTDCSCNRCGTEECNHFTGKCKCKPNVIGRDCDRCDFDHWGYKSCFGCRPCGCANASVSTACDDETGKCKCQPGVTGQTCNTCAPGYWKFTAAGCLSCNCAEKFSYGAVCDQNTGQCQCLPGVVGEKCDSCPHRWVFIPQTGCRECGYCVHVLLDDTDELANIIDPLKSDLQVASTSVFAYRKLNYVNKTMSSAESRLEAMKDSPKSVEIVPVTQSVQQLDDEAVGLQSKSDSLSKEVIKYVIESNSTREDADMVDSFIQNAILKSSLVVEDIKQLEESFQAASAYISANIDRRIQEVEYIVEELRKRELAVETNEKQKTEVEESKALLERVLQFNDPALKNKDQINETAIYLVKVIKLLSEMMTHSQEALKTAVKAEEMNQVSQNKQFDKKISQMKVFADEIKNMVKEANVLLDKTRKAITSDESLIIDLMQMTKRLDSDINKVKTHIQDSKNHVLNARPLVLDARNHVSMLKQQSDQLDALFAGTRLQSADYLRAANSYNLIVDELANASRAAEETLKAIEKASQANQLETVKTSKQRSQDLFSEAKELKRRIERDLSGPLNSGKRSVDELEGQLTSTSNNNSLIRQELEKFPKLASLSGLGQHAKDISGKAEAASRKSGGEVTKLTERIDVTKDKADKVKQDFDAVLSAIKSGNNYADRASVILPEISSLREGIKKRHENLKTLIDDSGEKIADLKRKIALARSQVNKIKTGVEFFPNTTLQIRNPDGLTKSATYTRLSLFFQTRVPDALLAYIGNPIAVKHKMKQKRASLDEEEKNDEASPTSRRIVSFDYMSLEIRGGNVVLNWDLGSGKNSPMINKKYVYDGKWHQVIAERIGKSLTLTVRTEEEDDSIVESIAQGPFSVFNLDQQVSRIFIGGIPDHIQVQEDVQNRRFTGTIEEVMLGGTPLGLWNYHEAENIYGAAERDSFDNLAPSEGLRFDGNGYAILPKGRQNFAKETFVSLKFRTYAKEGLLFLIGHERDFLALEIRDGLVMLKYELGSAPYMLQSNSTYNDGNWHSINANRIEKEGALYVDTVLVAQGDSIGRNTELSTTDDIYIGGYPNEHPYYDVTNQDFEGCIKEVQIGSDQLNLNSNKELFRAVPGCPTSVARTASFVNGSTGYIAIETTINFDKQAQITLKFKTQEARGLLFFVSSSDFSSYLAIYLDNGSLVLQAHPGGIIRTTHGVTYNDNQWHYITATYTTSRLRLDVDDINSFTIETAKEDELSIDDSTAIYFGGVTSSMAATPSFSITRIPSYFIGCFGDATVNDEFQNFSETLLRPNASLTTCPLSDSEQFFPPNYEEDSKSLTEILKTEKPFIEEEEKVSSTTPTPISSTPRPQPIGECKLAPVPFNDAEASEGKGLRFGNTQWSRHEFLISSAEANGLLEESGFQIEFKTNRPDGVILYVSSKNHIDFVALYLLDGKIFYSWNCGSGRSIITSSSFYNDGKWHKVTFSRKGKNGLLRIDDGREEYFNSSNGNANSLNVKSPIYIGGLVENISKGAKDNLRGTDRTGAVRYAINSFPGCLRELSFQGKRYAFGVESVGFDISTCSDKVEDGSFFHVDGGYIRLHDEFRVGASFTLTMEFKPRTLSGVLLAVFGQTDYLILYMNEGNLTFSVDNGAGPINVTYHPESNYYFCDGNWHNIEATKINNLVNIVVDKNNIEPSIGIGGVSSTDTKDPLYIGGLPDDLKASKGFGDNFVGCLRIDEINDKRQSLHSAKIHGHVNINSCSTL